jgi:hypothetical protein
MEASLNFIQSFFSFRDMLSQTLVKIVYFIGLLLITLVGVFRYIAGEASGGREIAVAILLVGNLVWRLICEAAILLFSVHEVLVSIEAKLSSLMPKAEGDLPPPRVLLSTVSNPALYVGRNAYDPHDRSYIGEITSIDEREKRCEVKNNFGRNLSRETGVVAVEPSQKT